ncbi:hypothetical protein MAPG_09037 [Magnaporthiopsis poae ATCC 64411]|uniref:Uncharacterized protein n=1 Tax=Magnaporthiopsis poae (strain ATCC 64411 / 73-15) TaxID=644358 RepID=A0A0C4E8W7_MAGP6|nr:hypothetical protein MAPG_09037 [Magnaporthiopsis poae ATCC 64411]
MGRPAGRTRGIPIPSTGVPRPGRSFNYSALEAIHPSLAQLAAMLVCNKHRPSRLGGDTLLILSGARKTAPSAESQPLPVYVFGGVEQTERPDVLCCSSGISAVPGDQP